MRSKLFFNGRCNMFRKKLKIKKWNNLYDFTRKCPVVKAIPVLYKMRKWTLRGNMDEKWAQTSANIKTCKVKLRRGQVLFINYPHIGSAKIFSHFWHIEGKLIAKLERIFKANSIRYFIRLLRSISIIYSLFIREEILA